MTHGGKRIDAVAQGTKHGLLFAFDRVTGTPLWPVHERPTLPSRIPGVKVWPTQPVPEKPAPLIRQRYTIDDVSTISPMAQLLTTERFKRSGNFGAMPPPSLDETILFPGPDGGFEWGGAAADPDGVLYANVNEIPWFYRMIPTRGPDGTPLSFGHRQYLVNCAACHGADRRGDVRGGMPPLDRLKGQRTPEHVMKVMMQGGGRMPPFDRLGERQRTAIVDFLLRDGGGRLAEGGRRLAEASVAAAPPQADPPYAFGGFQRWFDREGYPAIKPPWGTLNAVDMNTGEILWKVPLGEYPELTARGIPPTGTENYGGPVVTAGGLIFIGATADETFRAFDSKTGKILWQATAALQRQRHAEHVPGQRHAVRRDLGRRRQVEPPRRQHDRRLRAADSVSSRGRKRRNAGSQERQESGVRKAGSQEAGVRRQASERQSSGATCRTARRRASSPRPASACARRSRGARAARRSSGSHPR